jgi:hypothetical protein
MLHGGIVDLIVLSYCVYLLLGISLTLIVGRLVFNRGVIYLQDVFGTNQELASATNQLLRVGFYLVLGGYILLTLKITGEIANIREMLEILSGKLGTIVLAIGILHLFNLLILSTIRKNRITEAQAERAWAERNK